MILYNLVHSKIWYFESEKMKNRQSIMLLTLLCATLIPISLVPVAFSQTNQLLDPLTIPKFVNQLDQPPAIFVPTNVTDASGNLIRQEYTVKVSEFTQQILPTVTADGKPTGFGPTTVWGYEGEAKNPITGEDVGSVASTPGSTFEAIQGIPVEVKWVNNLVDSNGKPLTYLLPVDPTLHWANPNNLPMDMASANAPVFPPGYTEAQAPVPIVTHLHGGEVSSASDGYPDAWWTADGKHGPAYNTAIPTEANSAVFVYPNAQQPTTLWYHDHALGLTRLNVLSGLAGFYIIRNASDPVGELLPNGEYEMPLAIQDRSFLTDGSLYYPTEGINPAIHPYWQNAFLGNTIIVNGKAWPNMNVKQGQYRFRILDGSNSRFYKISFSNDVPFTQIGTEGGYLKTPVQLTSQLIAPAERIDILVDFSNIPAGQKIVLENFAGTADNKETTGQIMQFTVTDGKGFTPKPLPSNLNPTLAGDFPTLPSPNKQRILTLTDVSDPNGSEMLLLDGQRWAASVSETPTIGSTEEWVLVNPTMDAHPIHVHLVQFQVVKRQYFNANLYMAKWTDLNGDPPLSHATVNVPSLDTYLMGTSEGPTASEQGWKDTVIVNAGEVVTIRLRWTEQNGNPFPFDATAGPGYVWHCHMLEHEDNEMMRPYIVVSPSQNLNLEITVIAVVATITVAAVVLIVFKRFQNRSRRE
jgi:FtsP/CotA-like multicopper oxidase with cupredoxin domain